MRVVLSNMSCRDFLASANTARRNCPWLLSTVQPSGVCGMFDLQNMVGGAHVPRDRTGAALPVRKRLDHRGPLSIDVSGAWYFITICAEGHKPWVATKWPEYDMDGTRSARGADPTEDDHGRAAAPRLEAPSGCFAGGYPRPPTGVPTFDDIADVILREARENHVRGIWRLALFLVMPDHLHFIVHVPGDGRRGDGGGRGATALPGDGRRGAPTLPKLVANFKHLLAARYGLRFQRDFFDTRLRDEAHYAEKFRYICNNPVRKGLCGAARNWRPVIAFDRQSGVERGHR